MKVWKRCLAAVLAFTILYTSVITGTAAGVVEGQTHIWSATDALVVAGYYALDEKVALVLANAAINQGSEYQIAAPYDNGTEGKRDLVAVDYLEKKVYAKSYFMDGYAWLPTAAVIRAEGEEQESITLIAETCYFNNVEYYASQAFTYDGNSYSVEVIYDLYLTIDTLEQQRLLQIPHILQRTLKNMETSLKGMRLDLKDLGAMMPYLKQLIEFEYTTEAEESTESSASTKSTEEEAVTTPAFDLEEHAAEIAAVTALYEEYTTNKGLELYLLSEDYRDCGSDRLAFAMEHGAKVQELSASMYEHVYALANSKAIKAVYSDMQELNPEIHEKLYYLQDVLKAMLGTKRKPGPLVILKDTENWKILDPDVQASIFKKEYDEQDFVKLEKAVYNIRSKTLNDVTPTEESILAAQVGVVCDVTIFDINVTMQGTVLSGATEDNSLQQLEPVTQTVTLPLGATQKEVREAIRATGLEEQALAKWNAVNASYQINPANYVRTETELGSNLNQDIADYTISYEPQEFTIKTNFRGTEKLYYGYIMEFPECTIDEMSYDYLVENAAGVKTNYNQGVEFKITEDVTITRIEGSIKTEYRLYDFLLKDTQYNLSEAAREILASSAVVSPTVRIRIPDRIQVNEFTEENGVYSIYAKKYNSGVLGMTWEPYTAEIMNGTDLLERAYFDGENASWTARDFSHINVSYRLKIEKVKNGMLPRPIDESKDVLYALNLPHELVTSVLTQQEVLSGEEGITAKTIYQKIDSVKKMLSLLGMAKGAMQTTKGANAIIRLQGSEDEMIVGEDGSKLGHGGWNVANDELAIITHLGLCEASEWNVTTYYTEAYYEDLNKQAVLLAECFDAISADPGFLELLKLAGYEDKLQELNALVPELEEFADKLDGPHKALKVNDAKFASLIQSMLAMEGQTESYETSNGIYAYETIRRNGENTGSLIVSVQVGNKLALTREFMYDMEIREENSKRHILTEAEAAQIDAFIAELEAEFGMTEEEKAYYDLIRTGAPKAGEQVTRNETVSLVYNPKVFNVTIQGVSSDVYKASFEYGSDYVISLPARSEDPEDDTYYRYIIDGQLVKAANGTTGKYTFKREDLLRLFPTGSLEIIREETKRLDSEKAIPYVTLEEDLIRGSKIDDKNLVLYLDVDPEGISLDDFKKKVLFYAGDVQAEITIYNENRNTGRQNLVATGSTVDCKILDINEDEHITTYTVIIMGDINKDGVTDKSDTQVLINNYMGSADDLSKDESLQKAANMNGNKKYYDSNDALQMFLKYTNWNVADSEGKYKSVLTK